MKAGFDFATTLYDQFGPLIGGRDLMRMLGYKTFSAFNKAFYESRLEVPVFDLKGRKGKFAYTADVAAWLEGIGVSSAVQHKLEERGDIMNKSK